MTRYRASYALYRVWNKAARWLWVDTWRAGYLRRIAQIRLGRFYFIILKLEENHETK